MPWPILHNQLPLSTFGKPSRETLQNFSYLVENYINGARQPTRKGVAVVVQFHPWFKFYFPLF